MERRIAAIFAADMVGYSRLMEGGEADVLARQKTYFAEVFRPLFAEWRGRVIKGTGDGLIGVFDSVVDAVQCAVRIQRELAGRETGLEDRRISYRIAVNIGEVTFDEDDIFGDGVNVAARLESLAEPGGVVVSGAAHDVLKTQVEVGYRSLGEVRVKNIASPVRALQVVDDPSAVGQIVKHAPWRLGAIAATFASAIAVSGWWWISHPDFEPVDPATMEIQLPETASIAVLPFEALSDDSDVDLLARGLNEGLEYELTQSPILFVIAAADHPDLSGVEEARHVAATNGVRYVLGGSLQLRDGRIRVTASLVDTIRGANVWSQRFEQALGDESYFEIQDAIVEAVAVEVDAELSDGTLEKRFGRRFDSLKELRLSIAAIDAMQRWDSVGNNAAMEKASELVEIAPKNPAALNTLAWIKWQRVVVGVSQDVAGDLSEALKLSERALQIDPSFVAPRATVAWVHITRKDYVAAERSVATYLEQSNGIVEVALADAILKLGRPAEAEVYLRDALRRQPRFHDWVPLSLAEALLAQGELDEAREIYESLLNATSRYTNLHWQSALALASIHMRQNDVSAAERYVQRARKGETWMSVRTLRQYYFHPYRDREWVESQLALLAKAGLPEG